MGNQETPEIASPEPEMAFSAVVAGRGHGGDLQVIVLSDSGAPYVACQRSADGTWYWRHDLPPGPAVIFSSVAAGPGNLGNLQVVLAGSDDALHLLWQDAHSGAWHWSALPPAPAPGISAVTLAAGVGNDGNLQVVILDTAGTPHLLWQEHRTSHWHWAQLPAGPTRLWTLATGVGNDGNLQVVILDTAGTPHLLWQEHRTSHWHWAQLPAGPKGLSTLATGVGNDGNLQVVILDTAGAPHLLWQEHRTGTWHWGKLPAGPTGLSTPATGVGNDGNLQVLLADADGEVHLLRQDARTGGWAWGRALPDLGARASAFATGSGAGGDLEVVALTRDTLGRNGVPHVTHQDHCTGAWSPWVGLLPQWWNPRLPDVRTVFIRINSHGQYAVYDFPWYAVHVNHIQGMASYRHYEIFIRANLGGDYGDMIVVDRNRDEYAVFPTPHGYDHPDGCQVIGDYLALALDNSDLSRHTGSVICFYYLGAMTLKDAPTRLPQTIDVRGHGFPGANAVGITDVGTEPTRRYLVTVYAKDKVALFHSDLRPLQDPRCTFTHVHNAGLQKDQHWSGADNLGLVTQPDNTVYLVALNGYPGGSELPKDNYAVLYCVSQSATTLAPPVSVRKMSMHEENPVAHNWISFRNGAGIRVIGPTSLELYCSDRNSGEITSKMGINRFRGPASPVQASMARTDQDRAAP